MKLFMILLGCRPRGRFTEQHDICFCIGETMKDVVPQIIASWPEAKAKIHVDAWREVTCVDGYQISIIEKTKTAGDQEKINKLFFINLGGYKENVFDEFHYKMLAVAPDKGAAIRQAKQTAFYKHTGYKGATSHIDDKYGVDVDDLYEIKDILTDTLKEKFSIQISPGSSDQKDLLNLGYFTLYKL